MTKKTTKLASGIKGYLFLSVRRNAQTYHTGLPIVVLLACSTYTLNQLRDDYAVTQIGDHYTKGGDGPMNLLKFHRPQASNADDKAGCSPNTASIVLFSGSELYTAKTSLSRKREDSASKRLVAS